MLIFMVCAFAPCTPPDFEMTSVTSGTHSHHSVLSSGLWQHLLLLGHECTCVFYAHSCQHGFSSATAVRPVQLFRINRDFMTHTVTQQSTAMIDSLQTAHSDITLWAEAESSGKALVLKWAAWKRVKQILCNASRVHGRTNVRACVSSAQRTTNFTEGSTYLLRFFWGIVKASEFAQTLPFSFQILFKL